MLASWKKSYDKPIQHIKKQSHYFANRDLLSSKLWFFWQLCTESGTIKKVECWKNWCFWTVVLRKTLESSLDCKEIKPVNPKGNQPWVFIGKTDVKGETLILWLADAKSWFIGKDHDAGKDWGQEQREQQRMRWFDGITDSWTWV